MRPLAEFGDRALGASLEIRRRKAKWECPWCAEEILAEAKKCKHCGEYLTTEVPGSVTSSESAQVSPAPAEASPALVTPEVLWRYGGAWPHNWRCVKHDKVICTTCMKVAKHPTRGKVGQEVLATPSAGEASSELVCPHCNTKGGVTTKQVKAKKGISGGKATAAVMTMGISTVATGLSRKEKVTELTCSNCGMTWQVE